MTAIGIGIALAGLIVVFGAPDVTSAPFGAFMVLAATFFWSAGSLAMKRTGHIKPAAFLAYAYLISIPVAGLATAMLEDNQVQHFIDADIYKISFVVVYQVILMGIMTFVWSGLISRYPAEYVTPFMMLQPLVAVVGSYFMLGETLTIEVLLGGFIALFGVGLINIRRLKR
jgi:O-acetylserine/cysteine efflux transporter